MFFKIYFCFSMAPNFQMGLLTEYFAFEYFSLKWAKMRAIHFKRSISFEYVLLMDKHEQNTLDAHSTMPL